jgi:thiamine kinase-like enzyme
MRNNMYLFIEEANSWDGFEEVCDKMKTAAKSFDELGKKVYETSPTFNVLNHGDFHYNNMLFKTSGEGKISDVLFVSRQLNIFQKFRL